MSPFIHRRKNDPEAGKVVPTPSTKLLRVGETNASAPRAGEPVPASAPVDMDGEPPAATRSEIWAWYMWFIGANGIGAYYFAPTALQNLLAQAATDDKLAFAGRDRDVNSIMLLCNGISFALQAVLFLVIGAYADYGSFRRWVLLAWSLVAFGVGFGWLGVHGIETWRAAVGLFIMGLVSFQLTTTYWSAVFPSLARNTEHMRDCRARHAAGGMTSEELLRANEMERSRLCNVAFWIQSLCGVVILAVAVAIVRAIRDGGGSNSSSNNNNWRLSVLMAFSAACWLVFSLPWFVLEKTRPGLPTPPGAKRFTAGFVQLFVTATQIWRLKQSLVFLVGYFFLSDSLNTTLALIFTLQNQVMEYETLTLTYALLVNMVAQAAGVGAYWCIQKRFGLSVKTMFKVIMLFIILLDGWGMLGNWTSRIGFHSRWEIWAYQVLYGFLVCPFWSYSQIMISSVTPRGHESLFFSVFNVAGKASSLVGPFISSAIIDATPGGSNNRAPFYFLFALTLVSVLGIWFFLDLERSAREQEDFLAEESVRVYGVVDIVR